MKYYIKKFENQNGGINNSEKNINIEINKIVNYVLYIETDKDKVKEIDKNKIEEEKEINYILNKIFLPDDLKYILQYVPFKLITNIINNNPIEVIKNIIMDEFNLFIEDEKKRKISLNIMEKNKKNIISLIQKDNYKLKDSKILELINLAYEMFLLEEKSDIYRFIETCEYIAIKLNSLSEKNKLYVICPGDSPVKIIRYLEQLNLCPNCKFINFPISRGVVNDNSYNYISSYIPDDFCNIIILDLIDTGYTLTMIYNSLKTKIINNNKINNDLNKKCLEQIGICFTNYIIKLYPNLKNKINMELNINRGIFPIMEENYCNFNYKYILNILDYWGWNRAGIFAYAENFNARCIVQNEKHEILTDDLKNNINTFGCDFFVFLMVLCQKNYIFVKKQNFDNYFKVL